MHRFFWIWMMSVLVIAFYLLVTTQGVANAAPMLVSTDSGSIGNFKFTNSGISGNTATINMTIDRVAGSSISTIDTVNGVAVPREITQLSAPFQFQVTPTGPGQYRVSLPGNVVQTIGETPGQQAILGISITRATTPGSQPNFFNVSGPVTSLLANNNPSYDFSQYGTLGAVINTTFTATTFTGGANSFASLFTTPGATATGNGSFSEQSQSQAVATVPEPMSVASMSMGLLGVVMSLLFRRRFC